MECPDCHEPWLRPTNLPGRYRCVNCLHRFELRSVCPDCGEHSTIVRMSSTATSRCVNCGALDAVSRLTGVAPSILSRRLRAARRAGRGGHGRRRAASSTATSWTATSSRRSRSARSSSPRCARRCPTRRSSTCHLMIERPERHVDDFVKAGADNVTFHVEATPHVDYTMNLIREAGATAGVALNPGTAVEALAVKPDLALCMTVNPGWGGQPFIEALDRPHPRARRRARTDASSRSTAASTPRPRGRAPRRARRRSWRARRSSGRTTRPRPTGRSPPRRGVASRTGRARRAGDNGAHDGAHRPHRRRPPELPGHRADAARGRGLEVVGEAPDGSRGVAEARAPAARPRRCSTSTCPTSTASTSPRG